MSMRSEAGLWERFGRLPCPACSLYYVVTLLPVHLQPPSLSVNPLNPTPLPQVAKECVSALAAAARSGPDSIKDAAQLALTECTDDVCQGEGARRTQLRMRQRVQRLE